MKIEETAFLEKQLNRHHDLIHRMIDLYFDDENLAEDAATFIFEKLFEDDWKRLRANRQKSSFKSYLTSVVRNLSVDFYRQKFGRLPQAPKWIQRRGFLWERIYIRLCLRRWRPAAIIDHFKMRNKDPALVEEAIFLIRQKMPDCGKNRVIAITMTDAENGSEMKADSDAPLHYLQADEMDFRFESDLLLDLINTFLTTESSASEQDTNISPRLREKMQKFRSRIELKPDERLFLRLIFQEGFNVTQAGRQVNGWNANQSHGCLRRTMAKIRTAMMRSGLKEELNRFLKE